MPAARPTPASLQAADLFRQGLAIDEVARRTDRARSTTIQYLCDFLEAQPVKSVSPWVADEVYWLIAAQAERMGVDKLKPIFEALEGKISYDEIRIVLTHLRTTGGDLGTDPSK
jgi:ATP-dependent DNA helicase RecQ